MFRHTQKGLQQFVRSRIFINIYMHVCFKSCILLPDDDP